MSRGTVVSGDATLEAGRDGTHHQLKLKYAPTAIIATSDLVALGATIALSEVGLSVPQDMSVVTFDDTFVASLPQVGLTSVVTPRFELGAHGAQALLRKISDPHGPIERILLKPGFHPRSSTGVPREL